MSKRSEEAAFKAYPLIDGEMSKTQNANAGRMYARNIFKKGYEQAEKDFLEQEDGKDYVKVDREVLFEICDAILNHYAPESDTEWFWDKWNDNFRKKVEDIRKNS
jgi:hypothetical protein